MNKIQIQKDLRASRNLGYTRLEQSSSICLLLIALIVYAVDMVLEILCRAKGAKVFTDYPIWMQYTHIVVMVTSLITVIVALIVGIPGCVHLSNSGTMSKSQVASYIFYFIFTGWFVGLNVIVLVFGFVPSLQQIIPVDAHPYILYSGCALIFAAFVCSAVLTATVNRKQDANTKAKKVENIKKEDDKKAQSQKVEAKESVKKTENKKEAKKAKKEVKKAKKQEKKAKKQAKKVNKNAKKTKNTKVNKSSQAESINSMLMIENAELHEELDHLKKSRSAEKGWVSRKDEEVDNLEAKAKRAKANKTKTNSKKESINAILTTENAALREDLEHQKRARAAEKGWVTKKDEKVDNLEAKAKRAKAKKVKGKK